MKFKEFLNEEEKEETITEGYVSDELSIKVEWEFPEYYSIVLDAKSSKDAMQALQAIDKYGDGKLMDENGDMLDPDAMLSGFQKLVKSYGKVRKGSW